MPSAPPVDLLSNLGSAIVSTGGTTAPASGTSENWTVANQINVPAIGSSAQFRVVDAAQYTNPALAEIMLVTVVSGATWTVTRGYEAIGNNGTTPVAHAPNWQALLVATEGALLNLYPAAVTSFIGAPVTLTGGAASMIASVALPPGTWDITGTGLIFHGGGALNFADVWLGPNSAASAGCYVAAESDMGTVAGGDTYISLVCSTVETFTVATTVYLNGYASSTATAEYQTQFGLPNCTGLVAVPVPT